jgi:hypothetical protein
LSATPLILFHLRQVCLPSYDPESTVRRKITWTEGGKTKLSVCTLWRHMGNGCMAPLILHLGTRWTWVVSLTPQPPCHRGKEPLGEWETVWAQVWNLLENIKISSAGKQTPTLGRPFHSLFHYSDWAVVAPEQKTSRLFPLNTCVSFAFRLSVINLLKPSGNLTYHKI